MAKQTRRRFVRRRSTRRLPAKQQTGGGKLDKLPVGPGSRKADGTPEKGFAAAVNLNARRKAFSELSALSTNRSKHTSNNAYALHLQRFVKALPPSVFRTVLRPENYTAKYMELASLLPRANIPLNDPAEPGELIANVRDDFGTNWDFLYVMGHGVLAPELPAATVPERTYVRFNAPGGCRAVVHGGEDFAAIMAFPETFTLPQDTFLREMTKHYFRNTGPLESFSSLAERMTVAALPYPDEYCSTPRNLMSESTVASCLVNPLQKKQTIYGPGEKIQEMKINFSNNPRQMMMLGVYTLPIPRRFADALSRVSDKLMAQKGKKLEEMTPEEFAAAEEEQAVHDLLALGESPIPNPNLKKDWILQQKSLAEIFAGLPSVPAGKVRFLFINACRGVPFTLGDTGLVSDLLRGAPANDGRATGGAGAAGAAPVRRLNIPTRKNLAFRARRASLATAPGAEDELEKLLAARRVLRRAQASDGGVSAAERDAAQAIDDLYGLYMINPGLDINKTMIATTAMTLVPLV